MTQNDEKTQHQEPQLCPKCKEMYGHANFDFLCSLCYKYPSHHSENKRTSILSFSSPNPKTSRLRKSPWLPLCPNRTRLQSNGSCRRRRLSPTFQRASARNAVRKRACWDIAANTVRCSFASSTASLKITPVK